MLTATLSFLLAGLALTGSPGPNTLSMAAVGASFGRMRGIEYMIGLNLGMVVVIALVGTGMAGLVLTIPGFAPIVTVLAAGYFVYLAYRIATAPPLQKTIATDAPLELKPAPKWFEGFGLSLVNPKAYAAMAALFSGHVLLESSPVADGLWKAGLLILTICVVNIAWLCVGAAMTSALQNPRTSRLVNIAFAIILLLSMAYAVVA